MGLKVRFPQGKLPEDAAEWSRALAGAPVKPSAQSVTPNELADETTQLIHTTANAAAAAAADAAEAAAISAANTNASTLASSAQTTAISVAATSLSDHITAPNPHPVYLTQSEGDGLYLTQTQGDARYLQQTLSLGNYANDAAAAAGGVALNHLYRNGSVVMVRVV
jgi:hypothetical protein